MRLSHRARSSSTEVSGRALTNLECRWWISSHDEGQLSYYTGRGPRAGIVRYAVTDDQAVFVLPEYNQICQYTTGRQITLRVSALTANTFTEVIVTGIGYRAEDEARIAGIIDLPERWPSGVSTHLLCLDLSDLEGWTWCAEPAVMRRTLPLLQVCQ